MSYKNMKIIFKINLKDHIKNIISKTNKKKKTLVLPRAWRKWRKRFLCYRNSQTTKKATKKNNIEDEIDGLPEYQPNSPTDEDQEERDITKALQNQ